jgi:DNA-binding response OmpR family regulator
MWKVLFVDDDEEEMFLFDKAMHILNDRSDIYYAVCGDDLYYFLDTTSPDILFLDINLPSLAGVECLRRIRLSDRAALIPVIIYSAFTSMQLIDKCYDEKANYFLIKPREFEKVTALLKKVFSINWAEERFPLRKDFVIQ